MARKIYIQMLRAWSIDTLTASTSPARENRARSAARDGPAWPHRCASRRESQGAVDAMPF